MTLSPGSLRRARALLEESGRLLGGGPMIILDEIVELFALALDAAEARGREASVQVARERRDEWQRRIDAVRSTAMPTYAIGARDAADEIVDALLFAQQLAGLFVELDDDSQAKFFVEVARLMQGWGTHKRDMQLFCATAKNLRDAYEVIRAMTTIDIEKSRIEIVDVDDVEFDRIACNLFETVRKAHAAKGKS
jgi:hypothetical protein